MENPADYEQKDLINELAQGRELAKQLQICLHVSPSSRETRELLVHGILNSYDKALSMLKWNGSEPQPIGTTSAGVVLSESPRSLSGSPHSEDSDRDFKDPEHGDITSRKRKTMPRWTKRVQVCPGTGLEGSLDDGYSWRKYGQKDILRAKYPRGYYRCTHRNVRGCLATKQVQRSGEDPTIFEITYRGRHTCAQGSHLTPPPGPSSSSTPQPERQEPNTALENPQQLINNQTQQSQQQSRELLLNFRTGLKVITEDLDRSTLNQSFAPPPLYVPSQSMVDHNDFPGNFSASFVSPAASGSNYFSSTSQTGMGGFGVNRNFHSTSELTQMVTAATSSATNSPTVGLDFPFGCMGQFGPSFSFDNSGFSS